MPGLHRVCIIDLTALPPPADLQAASPPRGKPSRVPPAYGKASQTPFRDVEVKPGRLTLDFNVQRGKE